MERKLQKIFIFSVVLSLISMDIPVYAASSQGNKEQKPDIIEESRAQREKLQQSIANARAVLDSSSGSASSSESTDIIRHTNGAAPSNYKPHGQLDTRKYDSSKIYNSSYSAPSTTVNADVVETQDQPSQQTTQVSTTPPVSVMDTVGNTAQSDSAPEQTSNPGSATTSSSAQTGPVSSSAPIVETSNEAMSNKVRAIYNLLPEPIRSDYEANGWKIKIVPQDVIREQDIIASYIPKFLGILAGLTDTGQQIIFLDDEYGDEAMSHEMGHYVDMVLLGSDDIPPSYSEEFRSIYELEKEGFKTSYPKSTSHEYFAEAFSLYIECAGSMQQDFPRTYEYMDRLISPYGGTTTKGKILTQSEKDDRYGIDFADLLNFDDSYKTYLNDLKQMMERGKNSPAVQRGIDAAKKGGGSLVDTIISGIKEAQKLGR